ncbi:MAG: hypothetical protein AB1498_01380 [bacterium]
MVYLKLIQELQKKEYFVFSINDLFILFPDENKKTLHNQLTEWIKRKYIIRLKKGLYELTDKGSPGVILPDLFVANRLFTPSYISMETALSIYNIIPEVAFGVTSVTTNVTRVFKNIHGQFRYFSCRPKAFTGYTINEYSGFKVAIAEKEKAVVDFLYFRFRGSQSPDFSEERIDKDIIKKLDWSKLFYYCELYNERVKSMAKRLKEFIDADL